MNINKQYISNKNTNSAPNKPKYIVIHETDNFSVGANASRHAYAQYNGHLSTSVHFYCGSDGVYQVADYTSSCWSIGKTYSNTRPIMDATNYNVISIEICVNPDGNYTIARDNAIALTKFLMGDLGITEDRVIRHYDAKGKYCPRKMMDDPSLWVDFKNQIGSKVEPTPIPTPPSPITEYYRVGRDWQNGICIGQIGAFKSLDNAKNACKTGYNVFDDNGNVIYPTSNPQPISQAQPQQQSINVIYKTYPNKWLPEVVNCNDYAGIEGVPIKCLMAKSSQGSIEVRVHTINGKWLAWASGYNEGDFNNGFAGDLKNNIDAIQIRLVGLGHHNVQYRVSTTGSSNYLDWVTNYNDSNSNGYAGIYGKTIDKIQIKIV